MRAYVIMTGGTVFTHELEVKGQRNVRHLVSLGDRLNLLDTAGFTRMGASLSLLPGPLTSCGGLSYLCRIGKEEERGGQWI